MLMNAQADSPPCTMIIGREGRSYVHSLRHLTIVWRNLPQLSSLFFYGPETLPVLDFPLRAADGIKMAWPHSAETFVFPIVSNYYLTLV